MFQQYRPRVKFCRASSQLDPVRRWYERHIFHPECLKAHNRRLKSGWFDKYAPVDAKGIDIGCGLHKIHQSYKSWDSAFGDGDATFMEGVEDEYFEVVFTSHILEHLADPHEGLRNWFRILKPGGHLIISIPHRDLYEKKTELPSRWNPDHKSFWLPDKTELPDTLSLKKVLEEVLPEGEIVSITVRDDHYDSNGPNHPIGEFSIEAIIIKSLFS
jgi:SAM-dependent methyltransferase